MSRDDVGWLRLAHEIEEGMLELGDLDSDEIKTLDFNNLDFQASGRASRKGLNSSSYFADPQSGKSIVGLVPGQFPLLSYYKEHMGVSSFSSTTLSNTISVLNRANLKDAVSKNISEDGIIDWEAVAVEMNKLRKSIPGADGQDDQILPIECCTQYRSFCRAGMDDSIAVGNELKWNAEEEARLLVLVKEHNERDWDSISSKMGAGSVRTPMDCIRRYQQVLNPKLVKVGEWTLGEEDALREAVGLFGQKNWQMVSNRIPGRIAWQCKLKWRRIGVNATASDKDILSAKWTEDEERRLFLSAASHGMLTKEPPKRTAAEVESLLRAVKEGDKAAQADLLAKPVLSGKVKNVYGWVDVSKVIPSKSDTRCRDKWLYCLDPCLNKDKDDVTNFVDWTVDEDLLLTTLVQHYGTSSWALQTEWLLDRTDRQVANRWRTIGSNAGSTGRKRRLGLVLPPAMGRKVAATTLDINDFVPILRSGQKDN